MIDGCRNSWLRNDYNGPVGVSGDAMAALAGFPVPVRLALDTGDTYI